MSFWKHREGGDICAIFVHAGAGFHSFANEKHHLSACQDAAKVAMTILKNGGDATDAVEMAIKVLEDREITNAGYGSNLAIDGTVECDATIVDHLGRSGAVGAVSRKCAFRAVGTGPPQSLSSNFLTPEPGITEGEPLTLTRIQLCRDKESH
jgi:hypothetical protein